MPNHSRLSSACAILSVLLAAPCLALAAPEEIQVYRDEVTGLRAFSAEVNQSYVPSGPVEDIGPIGQAGLYRLTPELNYGFAPHWEGGVLAIATVRDGALDGHGIKAHVRYIAPRPRGRPWYWGVNAEVGWTDRHLEERPFTAEVRAIAGYEGGRWALAINPTLETAADGRGADPVELSLQTKLAYRIGDRWLVGLESYNTFGDTAGLGWLGRRSQMLYATADTEWRGLDLNVGVGKGLTQASDGWAVKMVIGVPLGR